MKLILCLAAVLAAFICFTGCSAEKTNNGESQMTVEQLNDERQIRRLADTLSGLIPGEWNEGTRKVQETTHTLPLDLK